MLIKLVFLAGASLLLSACTSQNGEDLLASGGVPAPACDTAHVTYAGTIAPLLQQQCSSCHGGSLPEAGFAVSSYAQVRAKAANGQLLGTVNHDPGFPAMPQGGAKLSDCDLTKLRQWVAAGAPNN
jgi:mono/diheme cytochrome c family protein